MTTPIKIQSTREDSYLDIRWMPNNVCNFKCRYCFPGSNDGDYPSPNDINLIIKNFKHLLNVYKEQLGKTKTHIEIIGGEPTLWKDLDVFVKEIKKEHNVYISLITNGSRTLRWWKEKGNLVDNVHLTHHVAQANLDHTISVADTMYELGKKITVKVLMDPTCWDKCVDAVEYLKKNSKHKWFVTVAEVIEPEATTLGDIRIIATDDLKYTSDQKKYMKWGIKQLPSLKWFWDNRNLISDGEIRYTESVATLENDKKVKAGSGTYINKNWNNFKGWRCNIGVDSIFINWDGTLKGSCGEFLYGLDYYHNILDANFKKSFNLEIKPTICSKFNCICAPETHLTKKKL